MILIFVLQLKKMENHARGIRREIASFVLFIEDRGFNAIIRNA
jgi:hypothetical protein